MPKRHKRRALSPPSISSARDLVSTLFVRKSFVSSDDDVVKDLAAVLMALIMRCMSLAHLLLQDAECTEQTDNHREGLLGAVVDESKDENEIGKLQLDIRWLVGA